MKKPTLYPFYCHVDATGRPKVESARSKDFETLNFHKTLNAPNITIAELAYRTHLRLREYQGLPGMQPRNKLKTPAET